MNPYRYFPNSHRWTTKITENERAELLLQSLPDSYDQLIINLTNNVLTDYLSFDDMAVAILEE